MRGKYRYHVVLLVMVAVLSVVSSADPAVGQVTSSQECSVAGQLTPPINLETTIEQFVQEMPAGGSNGYRNPLSDLSARNALVEGFNEARTGDLIGACSALKSAGYHIRRTTDKATGRQLALLQENKVNGSVPRAWGLYAIAWPPDANSSTLSVEVPHACPQASFFHVCLFNNDSSCSNLGATRNIQKNHMSGGRFVHVEANENIVNTSCGNPCRRNQLADAIVQALQ